MRYQKLPLDRELERLLEENPDAALKTRTAYFLETIHTPGFQLVVALLRDLDRTYTQCLRSGTYKTVERMIGRLECIEEIRRSLTALLPKERRPDADWADAEEEEYVNIDESPLDNKEGEKE